MVQKLPNCSEWRSPRLVGQYSGEKNWHSVGDGGWISEKRIKSWASPFSLQANNGRSPTGGAGIQFEFQDPGMIFQEGMNGAAKHTLALAMDDPHFVDVFFKTCAEILLHHGGHLLGVESVEVEDPVDRDMDYVII